MDKKRVIVVTDGDSTAQKAVEEASKNLNLRVISKSGGNPTPCSGKKLLSLIQACPTDPVVVMFDDEGNFNCGKGEHAMEKVMDSEEIEVLGVVAVASNAKDVEGIHPDCSITREGKLVSRPVDKEGEVEKEGHVILEGDTVDILNSFDDDLLIVGIGDVGKMSGKDSCELGAPITTKALEEILKRGGVDGRKEDQD
ncbi:stage V sporulation protein AE [Orenia metallireducens]|uniref:Stage V sporulation protein AE n=1 Tax=Orenia metallireducens TaxID=1413210 RepID=A0A285HKJ7_9FIRM|nr:stage V sporulation protein AE [Orenia metallireducens]SNY36242.1 stage V sporulation protein AE [Orenia metallireducens]